MFPRIVAGFAELEMEHGPPFRASRLVEQLHAGFRDVRLPLRLLQGTQEQTMFSHAKKGRASFSPSARIGQAQFNGHGFEALIASP